MTSRSKVDLFIPCFIDQVYPDIGFSVIKILKKLSIEVNYNPKQTCCGQPSFNSGYWKETEKLAKKFLKDFPNNRLIVSPSGSCAGFIKKYYFELSDDKSFRENCSRVSENIYELTDFLVNYLKKTDIGAEFNARVTYHDSCAALREYGIKDEPRELLSKVKGLELVEMNESDTCCGFGGTFSVKMEPISTAMAEQKVENALKTGAEYIVSTEASCLLNIESYIKKHKLPIRTIHIADILASGW
jgi:L-lactate dehydrogenase complex protein LldE